MDFKPESQYSLDIFYNNDMQCDWNTIYFGYLIGRLKLKEIKKFALDFCEDNPLSITDAISALIFEDGHSDMDQLLKNIFISLNLKHISKDDSEWNLEWTKWRYCIASEMNKCISDRKSLLRAVEGLYADFGYPEDMDSFIYYMPSTDLNPELDPDKAEQNLIKEFHIFLREEKLKIESDKSIVLPKRVAQYE